MGLLQKLFKNRFLLPGILGATGIFLIIGFFPNEPNLNFIQKGYRTTETNVVAEMCLENKGYALSLYAYSEHLNYITEVKWEGGKTYIYQNDWERTEFPTSFKKGEKFYFEVPLPKETMSWKIDIECARSRYADPISRFYFSKVGSYFPIGIRGFFTAITQQDRSITSPEFTVPQSKL